MSFPSILITDYAQLIMQNMIETITKSSIQWTNLDKMAINLIFGSSLHKLC